MIDIDFDTVLRYMGQRTSENSEDMNRKIDEVHETFRKTVRVKHVHRVFPIELRGDSILFSAYKWKSKSLSVNLSEC